MIIAIDGPAGAGKSTVARILAQELGFLYIDTGAMYRALTLKAIAEKIALSDTPRIIEMARVTGIDVKNDSPSGSLRIFLDGEDVTQKIRHPAITKIVSDIAKIKEVRQIMLGLQRAFGKRRDSVLDGRDIGSVVFPGADKKFYLDAKFEVRVMRRFEELKGLGEDVTLAEVREDLHNRDTIDTNRDFAPLKKAEDAIYVDTTDMSIEQVVENLLKWINL